MGLEAEEARTVTGREDERVAEGRVRGGGRGHNVATPESGLTRGPAWTGGGVGWGGGLEKTEESGQGGPCAKVQ